MNPFIRLLHLLPPETAHRVAIRALKLGLYPRPLHADDPMLRVHLWGKVFANPIGLAAGFDKNAEALIPALKLGFGFVEAGTVTPLPQPGNPTPRLFRIPELQAVINRLGFNNEGLAAFVARLARVQKQAGGVVGGNIGRNKNSADAVADYLAGLQAIAPLVDYVTVNISSPNTPGLRGLQDREAFTALLAALQNLRASMANPPPLLVKIAPDLEDAALEALAEVALAANLDGLIVSNTTITRPAPLNPAWAAEAGGLSGAPLFALSTRVLGKMYRLTAGKLPLIGVGGIRTAEDAYQKIRHGASLLQLYTALIYEGPWVVARLKQGLCALLRRDGFDSVSQAVGIADR